MMPYAALTAMMIVLNGSCLHAASRAAATFRPLVIRRLVRRVRAKTAALVGEKFEPSGKYGRWGEKQLLC